MTIGKTIALTRWSFVGKVMSLLFNMLSRLVIVFLPRSKHLLISWLQTWVQSLGQENPLEKRMANHSSILAWRIPWREEPGRLLVHGVTKSWTRLTDFTSLHFINKVLWYYIYVHILPNII